MPHVVRCRCTADVLNKGTDRDKCILVRNPMVSRDHAVVRRTFDGVEIADQSKNGTWINDVRMAPGASQRLEDGDCITLGGLTLRRSCPHLTDPREADVWSEQTAISPSDVSITSLVADVRGFSALSQKADSAVVYSLIKEIFARFSSIVIALLVMCGRTAALVRQSLPVVDLGNQDIRGRSGQEHLFGIEID